MDQATFGIVGVGGIAQSQHLPNATRAPHVFLKTACDVRDDVLSAMREKYSIPHVETNYKKILDDPDIDAVIVATREDMQAPLTIEALHAGKHVYVEKPLANTPDDVKAVVEAQRASGKFVAVGFNRRFAPAYRLAREIIMADGGAKNVHYRISDEYWRWGVKRAPGIRIIHEVCHIFDILRWFTDSEVATIYCAEARPDDEAVLLTFRSGCVATIMSSGYVTMDLPKERVEIVSELGAITVEEFVEVRAFGYHDRDAVTRFPGHSHPDREFTHKYLLKTGGADALHDLRRMAWEQRERFEALSDTESIPDRAELTDYVQHRSPHWNYMVDKGWLAALDHFAESVLTGRAPENASAADGLWASRLSNAAIESRNTGKVIALD